MALDRIESDVARELSTEIVLARYGLSEAVLARHLDVCLAPPTPETLLRDAVVLQRAALRVLHRAVQEDDSKTAMQAIDRADKAVATIGKLIGAFSDGAQIDARQQTINLALGDLSVTELRKLASGDV